MPTELTELARRAVACKGWRWVPGMLTLSGARILLAEDDGAYVLMARRAWTKPMLMEDGELPDFADAATLGCLLSLVREAWNEPHMSLECRLVAHYGKWEWTVLALDKPKIIPVYAWSEAEALVAALEAAP
jgi:hypothetical protein